MRRLKLLFMAALFVVPLTLGPIEMQAATSSTEDEEEDEEDLLTVTGFYSLNNNNKNTDYKIDYQDFVDLLPELQYSSDYAESYCNKSPTRSIDGVSKYESYLIENDQLSRPVNIGFTDNVGMTVQQIDWDDSALLTKTELYTTLYKIYFGVIPSRTLAFNTPSVRTINGVTQNVHLVEHYKLKKDYYVTAKFEEGDYYLYNSPDVYELYLTKLLEKGFIKEEDIGDTTFLDEYHKLENNNSYYPEWFNTGSVYYKPGKDALGHSFNTTSSGCTYVGHSYFKDESLTVIEALDIIEQFLRDSDKQISDLEASVISYKYGVVYLDSLTSADSKTLAYLIAAGIVDFENEVTSTAKIGDDITTLGDNSDAPHESDADNLDDNQNNQNPTENPVTPNKKDDEEEEDPDDPTFSIASEMYDKITRKEAYKLLYRVANKAARFDFSKITLTDQEAFWQSKGYSYDNIKLYDDESYSLPDMRVVSATSTITEDIAFEDTTKDLSFFDKVKKFFLGDSSDSHDLVDGQTVYAAKNSGYVVEVYADTAHTYTYDDVQIRDGLTTDEIEDLDSNVSVVTTPDASYYDLKFSVSASDKSQAIAIVNAKLICEDLDTKGAQTVSGVTKVTSDNGDSITLLSEDAIKKSMSEIKVINDSTLANSVTGTTAMFLPDSGYALIGNKIVVSPDIMVKDSDGTIYYNLEVLCALMSNTYLSKINGATSVVSTITTDEQLYDVVSLSGAHLEKNYVTSIEAEGGTGGVSAGTMYNVDTLTRASNCIVRTFNNISEKNSAGNTSTSDITMIVQWDLVVPPGAGISSETYNDSADNLTFEKATEILTTKPKDKQLAEWWDLNLGMSNALANFMYGTQNTTYFNCGYLVPSVTVLSEYGNRGDGNSTTNVKHETGALSDAQLNNFFDGSSNPTGDKIVPLSFGKNYTNKFFDGSTENWWSKFYGNSVNSLVKNLILNANFTNLAGTQIFKGGSANGSGVADGTAFGNDHQYIVLKNGKVFRDASKNTDLDVSQGTKTIRVRDTSDKVVVDPTSYNTKVTVGNCVFMYVSTETFGGKSYYRLVPYSDTSGNGLFYKAVLKKTDHPSDSYVQNLDNYCDSGGNSIFDYETALYKAFGMNAVPTEVTNVSKKYRFMALDDVQNFAENVLYGSVSGNNNKIDKFYIYKRDNDGNLSLTTEGNNAAIIKDCTTPINFMVSVYLPISDYYFANNNGSISIENNTVIPVVGSGIYYTSLNNMIRDNILLKLNGVVSINDLDVGNQVFIGSTVYTKEKGDKFSSSAIADSSVVQNYTNAYFSNNPQSMASALLSTFNSQSIYTAGRAVNLTSFVRSIDLGKQIVDEPLCLFSKGDKPYYTDANGEVQKYENSLVDMVTKVSMTVKFDDRLKCIPLNNDSTVYQLLYSSDSYASSGLEDLPFYPDYSLNANNGELGVTWKTSEFKLAQFITSIKDDFLKTYREGFSTGIVGLLKMIAVTILMWLIFVSWIGYVILHYGIGLPIFTAIAEPNPYGFRNGLDLIKILSLGVYDINDDPSFARMLVLSFIFFILMYVLVDVI